VIKTSRLPARSAGSTPGGRSIFHRHYKVYVGLVLSTSFDPSSLLRSCLTTVRIVTAPAGALSDYLRCVQSSAVAAFCVERHHQRRIKMRTLLVMGTFLLVLLIAGCTVSPTATPGPAGPAGQSGQTGQTGQSGQQGDQGQSGQQGATGQSGDPGQTGQTGDEGRRGKSGDQGRPGQTGDQGRPGQTGDQGRQGNDAPCPAGEHHYTNPNTGRVSCVRD
jgi:hypothetical protein